ncbi:condensin complex subunit 2 isoform X2 [Macrobrachium rosenbergii]
MRSHQKVRPSFGMSPVKRRSDIAPILAETPVNANHYPGASDGTPLNDDVFMDVPENNDEKEKKERQLNRLQQQIQARTFSSPSATPSDRRKSLSSVAGLTNQELSEHYSKCIQLNAENKISVKNAFNLQLIDYMSEMLKRKDSDMNNFQVASCTLDASTKIYAYRVDSVHTDTLKMAGGLGRTQDKEKKDGDGEMVEDDRGISKRKPKTKKKAVIEANLRNINISQFDLEFDVDPLFKKMTSQFDEGSSGRGQFLNTLQLMDDTCQMMLDAETILKFDNDAVPVIEARIPLAKLSDLREKFICPTFSQFEFTKWKVGDQDTFLDNSRMDHNKQEKGNDHRFDVDAVPEPLDDEPYDEEAFGMETAGDILEDGENGTVITVGQGGCHKIPPLMEAVHLKDHLSDNPSEYSYFDQHRMMAWAGPQHWRLKPLSKVKSDTNPEDAKRRKKTFITLEYLEDHSINRFFEQTRKTTKLSHITLKSWSNAKTTLPIDLHYDARNFTKLHGRPAIVIRRQSKAAAVDDSVTDYNYDNPNDRDNYCADMDDAASNYGDQTVGYDMTEIFSQTVINAPALSAENDKCTGNLFDNLVAAPNKVAKINIGYARQAKRIDMKKLKGTMWTMLSDTSTNKENERGLENQAEINREPRDQMEQGYKITFNKLFNTLPSKLSAKMTESLSVPLAFIALLHLANEHNLKLNSIGELQDFVISQG